MPPHRPILTASFLILAAAAALAADTKPDARPDTSFAPRAARQRLCEALADWSLQTGAKYCYSSWLPEVFVVVSGPGEKVSLADVLRPLGWSITPSGDVFVVARDGDDGKAAELRKTLLEDKDELARRTAAYALGKLTVPSAMAALLEGLADANINIKFQCLESLMKIESDFSMRQLPGRVTMLKASGEGKADSLKPLADLAASAASDKPRRAWRYSVELLGRADSPLARELALAGSKDADERVRRLVLRITEGPFAEKCDLPETEVDGLILSIEQIGSRQGEREQILVKALGAEDPWRRAAAADGLAVPAKQRSAEAVDALIKLQKDDSPLVRAAAARALGVIATEPARKAVLETSKDANPQVRLAAVRALKRFGGAAALARLNELAADPDADVKAEALHGLGWLGGVKEADKLAAIAKDKSLGRDGPDAALEGLGALLDPKARDIAVATLLELMDDPKTCPWAVGRAAVALNDPRLLPGLLKVLGQNRAGAPLRVDCVDAIGQLGTKETTLALAKNWWEYENMARYQHGRALRENLDHGQVFETLLALAKSPGAGDSHMAATFSLSNSRDPAAVAALVEILTARKGDMIGAGTSLGLIADPAATDTLLAAATDPTHPARFVAARALRQRDLAWQPKVKAALNKFYGWRDDGGVPPVAEQKPGTWMLRRYQRDFDDMTVSTLTYESAIAYDSRRGKVYHWGAHGKRYDSPQTGDTWAYDGDDNSWTELALAERPPGTCMTRQICYDSANDKLIVRSASGGGHGWLYYPEQRMRQSMPWAYDPQSDRWLAMRAPRPDVALSNLVSFDEANGVVVWAGRPNLPPPPKRPEGAPKPPPPPPQPTIITVYDSYTNTFTVPATQPNRPVGVGFHASAYDSRRGRTLFLASDQLWAYSLTENSWTNLKPAGEWPQNNHLLVYDSANDAALTFRGSRVYAYDCQANQWLATPLPADGEMRPDYHNWDATFDAKHNVVVIAGGEITSCPGSPNCRELWTYRVDPAIFGNRAGNGGADKLAARPAAKPIVHDRPPVVTGIVATWNADRKACVRWDKSPAADVVGYNVYRAIITPAPMDSVGPIAGMSEYVKVNDKPVDGCEFVDPEVGSDRFNNEPLPSGWALAPRAYRVAAVNKQGAESGPASRAITLPDTTRSIQARRRDDGSVVVRWAKDPDPNVVGYVVFRQDNWSNSRAWRCNPVPVVGTTYIDPADGIPAGARPTGERQRYWVVAVDRFGQMGPSGTGAWSFNR